MQRHQSGKLPKNISRRSFVRLLALTGASQVLVPQWARADEPDWVTNFLPAKWRKAVDYAVDIGSAFNDLKNTADVIAKISNFLSGGDSPTNEIRELKNWLVTKFAHQAWYILKSNQEEHTNNAEQAVTRARELAMVHKPVSEDAILQSQNEVGLAFKWRGPQSSRPWNYEATKGQRSRDSETFLVWNDVFKRAGKSDIPPIRKDFVDGGFVDIVYDWRIGLPQMLYMIALRIQLIAAADPEFRQRISPEFGDEFLDFKNALERRITSTPFMDDGSFPSPGMADAVQSAYTLVIQFDYNPPFLPTGRSWAVIASADLYTGMNRVKEFRLFPGNVKFPDVLEIETELRREVTDVMPFDQMKAMIDTLNLLAFNSPSAEDGTLMQEPSAETPYIILGGAKFLVPWRDFDAMGLDSNDIQKVATDSMRQFGIFPRDGTLLSELNRPEVYIFRDGKKVHVPNEDEFNRLGLDFDAIQIVPDGSTAWMPTKSWDWFLNPPGAPPPPPNPP